MGNKLFNSGPWLVNSVDLSNTDPISILGQLERLTFKSPYLEDGHF